MLVERIHEIKLCGRNISHYIKIGLRVNRGDIIYIETSKLHISSKEEVYAECSYCLEIKKTTFQIYKRCKKGFVCSSYCKIHKTTKNLFDNTGLKNYSQLDSVKLKKINSSMSKFGVENVSQSKCVRDKVTDTVLKKYGVTHISKNEEIKKKKEINSIEKFGFKTPLQNEAVKLKIINTIRVKYDDEYMTNISQSSEVMDSKVMTGFKSRVYEMPSGKKVKIQGYENYCIEYLLKNGYEECDLVIGNKEIENYIGKIYYKHKNKNNRYFPDIFIPKENKIIEVKSDYTMTLNTDLIIKKMDACIKASFEYFFYIFDIKGNLSYIL
jgi:hypothetical protein